MSMSDVTSRSKIAKKVTLKSSSFLHNIYTNDMRPRAGNDTQTSFYTMAEIALRVRGNKVLIPRGK